MKEAAGEANMTVITIVLIGVVAAVGLVLVPRLMSNASAKACCTDTGWYVSGSNCCDPDPKYAGCSTSGHYSTLKYIRNVVKNNKTDSRFYTCMGGE